MPRYFFHSHTDAVSRDEEGIELPDHAAAIDRVAYETRVMAADEVLTHGTLHPGYSIQVADQDGSVLKTVTVAEAVDVKTDPTGSQSVMSRG